MALPINALIKRLLPASLYPVIRDLPYMINDRGPAGIVDATDLPIPRLRDQFDGERGYEIFKRNGTEAFNFYREVMGLRPDWKILDIGSGIGRKTRPLLKYIDEQGLYVGMDIDERGVKWCSENLSPINDRFVFFKLNVYNRYYNPSGAVKAERIVFPFPDNGFDMVVLWSVFTHMHTKDIARYLQEIARILKPGGRVASSYLLMNERARATIEAKSAKLSPIHPLPGGLSWTNNPNVPEDAIAVDEAWLRRAYQDAGLVLREPVMAGDWSSNRSDSGFGSLNFQDIVVAEKPA